MTEISVSGARSERAQVTPEDWSAVLRVLGEDAMLAFVGMSQAALQPKPVEGVPSHEVPDGFTAEQA